MAIMTQKEYDILEAANKKDEVISAKMLTNTTDRTLLYGYTCARETFHVYLKNNEIHTIVYIDDYSGASRQPKNIREILVSSNYEYIPDKRLYPETCDYEFCKLLKERNISLPFTAYNEDRDVQDFYGFVLEDA